LDFTFFRGVWVGFPNFGLVFQKETSKQSNFQVGAEAASKRVDIAPVGFDFFALAWLDHFGMNFGIGHRPDVPTWPKSVQLERGPGRGSFPSSAGAGLGREAHNRRFPVLPPFPRKTKK
jgi:hypothetical protein